MTKRDFTQLSSVRFKCPKCFKIKGVVAIQCWEELSSSARKTSAFRVLCTSCSEPFRIIFNPVICLGCSSEECRNTLFWNRWEDA